MLSPKQNKMGKDYYTVLGVSKDADEKALKKGESQTSAYVDCAVFLV